MIKQNEVAGVFTGGHVTWVTSNNLQISEGFEYLYLYLFLPNTFYDYPRSLFMKKQISSPRALVLLAALAFAGFSCQKEPKETGGQAQAGNKSARTVPVDVFVVEGDLLEQVITATGNIIPNEAVEIRPERSGKLVSLGFREATYVEKGRLLAKIDDADLLAQKDKLAVQLKLAEIELERARGLLAIQAATQEEVDRLSNRVEELKADQRILDVQLDRSKVLAPFDGYVGLRDISEGAYVTPQNVLVDLQQINPIKLEFEVPEKYLSLVKNGQELTFFVSGSEQQYKARVYALSSDIAPSTRTFTVRATATNGNNQLKPGQFAKVELVTGVNESAIIVPTDAVIPVIDGKQVYVFRDGKAIGTAVTTGTRLDARVEITDGLQVGDSIIVSGLLSLTNGTPVQVNKLIKP